MTDRPRLVTSELKFVTAECRLPPLQPTAHRAAKLRLFVLLRNELVSNSLKRTFPAGKESEIRIDPGADNDNKLTLMVSDSGVGFPNDLDFRDTESLGLQLVNTLVNQLEGTVELDGSGGATVRLHSAIGHRKPRELTR